MTPPWHICDPAPIFIWCLILAGKKIIMWSLPLLLVACFPLSHQKAGTFFPGAVGQCPSSLPISLLSQCALALFLIIFWWQRAVFSNLKYIQGKNRQKPIPVCWYCQVVVKAVLRGKKCRLGGSTIKWYLRFQNYSLSLNKTGLSCTGTLLPGFFHLVNKR